MRKSVFIVVLLILCMSYGCFDSGKGTQAKETTATPATEIGSSETYDTVKPTTEQKETETVTTKPAAAETNATEQPSTQSTAEQIPVETKPQNPDSSLNPGENETPGDSL